MSNRKLNGRRGFSLIELSLIIGIIAVLGAVALPHYSYTLSTYHAAAAAKRIATDIALVRSTAKFTSQSLTITFNPATASYQVVGMKPLDGTGTTYNVSLAVDPYKSTISSAGFGTTTLITQLTFDRFGSPSSAGAVVVGSNGGVFNTISVDGQVGTTSVQIGNYPATVASNTSNSNGQNGNNQNGQNGNNQNDNGG